MAKTKTGLMNGQENLDKAFQPARQLKESFTLMGGHMRSVTTKDAFQNVQHTTKYLAKFEEHLHFRNRL